MVMLRTKNSLELNIVIGAVSEKTDQMAEEGDARAHQWRFSRIDYKTIAITKSPKECGHDQRGEQPGTEFNSHVWPALGRVGAGCQVQHEQGWVSSSWLTCLDDDATPPEPIEGASRPVPEAVVGSQTP